MRTDLSAPHVAAIGSRGCGHVSHVRSWEDGVKSAMCVRVEVGGISRAVDFLFVKIESDRENGAAKGAELSAPTSSVIITDISFHLQTI